MMIVGSGIDILEVDRLKKAIDKWGDSILKRVFTKKELNCAKTRNFDLPHLAGRFAAKEAVFKALSNIQLGFKDIEILNNPDGKPICHLISKGRYPEIILSISHAKDYAVASAIAIKKT